MPDNKIDQQGYSAVNDDEKRDLAAKGGPASGLGTPDSGRGVSHPYDEDIQTQLAAKSTQNKKGDDDVKSNERP